MKSGSAYLGSLLVLSHITAVRESISESKSELNGATVPFAGLHDMCGLGFSPRNCTVAQAPTFLKELFACLFLLCFFFFISLIIFSSIKLHFGLLHFIPL
jgi:hypothetical protein